MTLDQAIKATRNGAIAAVVSGAITIALMIVAISNDSSGIMANFSDPLIILDAVFLFVCAFGVFKHSRFAAVVLLLFFIISKMTYALDTGAIPGVGVSLIFLYFYANAIYGAFTYHKFKRQENPEYRAISKIGAFFLGSGALILSLMAVFIVLMSLGVVPSSRVLAGSEISEANISTLKEEGILLPDEKVAYFYSQGLTSILEGGNILTNKRVITYFTDEQDQITNYPMQIEDVVSVALEESGSSLSDSVYLVKSNSPNRWIRLHLSVEQKGDEKFVAELRDLIN